MPRGLAAVYWTLLHMLDEGQECSVDEVYQHIDKGDVIDWLAVQTGQWATETGLPGSLSTDAREVMQGLFERHRNATTPSDYGVANNGLCLLLAYCLNELQTFFY